MISASISRRIWHDAVGELTGATLTVIAFLLFATAVGGFVGVAIFKSLPLGILRGAGNPLAMLAFLYWTFFMSGAAAQNKPANACLVPGLTRRVRQTAVLAWLLTMAPFAAVSVAHPQGWLMLLSASVGVTAFGLYRAGCESFLWLAIAAAALYLLQPNLGFIGDAVLAAACLVSVLFAAWALARAFPKGGERHFAMLDKHAKALARDRSDTSDQLARRSGKQRFLYSWVLRRDIGTGHRGRLLMHVLGPGANRMLLLLPVTALALAVFGVTAAMHAMGYWPNFEKIARQSFGPLLVGVPVYWYRFAAAIRGSGPEQALARLAPRLPPATRLNRELALQILMTCALEWIAVAALALGTLVLWDAPALSFRVTPAFLLAMLPVLGIGLADYSGKLTYRFAAEVAAAVVCAFIAMFTIFYGLNTPVWLALMALILCIAAVAIRAKWRAMLASPPAFPAGRIA